MYNTPGSNVNVDSTSIYACWVDLNVLVIILLPFTAIHSPKFVDITLPVLLDNNKLLQSVYYYYNMTNSYGPMFVGWQSSVELKQNKFNNKIQKIKNMNFGNIKILCKDFKDIFDFHKNDFLYLDPPYYLNGDSKLFKGMYPNCNFAIHHNNFNHQLLFELLQNHNGGFILTYNNCEYIKDLYKDYEQVFPSWNYSYGNGETRIGKNRLNGNNTNIKESHEIFIICPPIV